MYWLIGKIADIFLGRIMEEIILLHEAYGLSKKERQIVKDYTEKTFELEKNPHTDNLIRKNIAAKATNNRVIFTVKGEKLKKVVKRYRLK